MAAEFKLMKAESWNDGKGGAPYMWIVFVGDNPTAYYGLTLDAALNFIKQFK